MYSGIYRIRNLVNNQIYIGSALNLRTRKNQHFSLLSLGKHFNIHLQRSYDKHGSNNFVFEHLLVCDPNNLILYEQLLIDKFKPEYNISPVAGSPLGVKRSEETKRRIGEVSSKRKLNSEQLKRHREVQYLLDRKNKTGFVGVQKMPSGSYRAKITINHKQIHLGCYSTPEEAYEARMAKLSELLEGEGG